MLFQPASNIQVPFMQPQFRRATAPGGGAGDIPTGMKLWLPGDAYSLGTWADQSGGGHDFTQVTSGTQPAPASNVVNGHSAVRFDGGDYMQNTGLDAGSETTWFFVINSVNANAAGLFDTGPSNGNVLRIYAFSGIEWHSNSPALSPAISANTWVALTIQTSLTPGRSLKRWIDGGSLLSDISATTTGVTWANPVIGGVNLGSSGFFTGDVAEVILYDSALAVTPRESVEDYLGAKYAITITH